MKHLDVDFNSFNGDFLFKLKILNQEGEMKKNHKGT